MFTQAKRKRKLTIKSTAEIEQSIATKLKHLKIIESETNDILAKKNTRQINRHKMTLEQKLDEVHELKARAFELKLESDEELAMEWRANLNKTLSAMEQQVEEIEETITKWKHEEKEKQHREEEIEQQSRLDTKMKEELEIEKAKLELRKQDTTKGSEQLRIKLPKLIITKFQGNHLDWLRFWNEFEVEIDRASIPPVSKFAYLKELLVPKARIQIDGLPFTTEGYERAKTILKTTYGRPSEVANAHIHQIIGLPLINHHNVNKIHEFYEKLVTSVQSLDTMGKLKDINGYVRLTLDKLPTIRADLVRLDDDWQEWSFGELTEALRKWTVRNPKTVTSNEQRREERSSKIYHAQINHWKQTCVFCGNDDHRSSECKEINEAAERKKIVAKKRLCFNCIKEGHRVSECPSKRTCYHCGQRHHTSICELNRRREVKPTLKSFAATTEEDVIFPMANVKVNGINCRALLDTGAGGNYISASLIEHLKIKPARREKRSIEMLMNSISRNVNIYQINISNLNETFHIDTEATMVDKRELLTVPNPKFEVVIKKYQHLRDIKIAEKSNADELPIHLILGVSEISKSKTATRT